MQVPAPSKHGAELGEYKQHACEQYAMKRNADARSCSEAVAQSIQSATMNKK